MIKEVQLRIQPDGAHQYREGYFVTINTLAEMVRDFQADQHDGFVSNDEVWIEEWLKKQMGIIR